jgi:hypothetical protein
MIATEAHGLEDAGASPAQAQAEPHVGLEQYYREAGPD